MIKTLTSLATAALCLQGGAAHAGPRPSYDISQLEIGTVMEWQTHRGTQSTTYLGPDAGLFKVHMRSETRQGEVSEADRWLSQSGQSMRLTAGDFSMSTVPHNCENIAGDCSYTLVVGAMVNVNIAYFGTYTEDGILVTTRSASDPDFMGLIKKQCTILDQYGQPIVNFGIGQDDNIYTLRRINSPYDSEIAPMLARVRAQCLAEAPPS